jgi:hypothetical protein
MLITRLSMKWLLMMAVITVSVIYSGCKEPENVLPETNEGILEINLVARVSGKPLVLRQPYKTILNQTFVVELLKIYVSKLALITAAGEEIKLDTLAHLYDYAFAGNAKNQHGEGLYLTLKVKEGAYKGIKLAFGLDSATNATDPAIYQRSHSLSILRGTYWDWATGYRFLMLEGKIDSSLAQNQPPQYGFTYHTGTNSLFLPITFDLPSHSFKVNKGRETQFIVELDINRLFYNSNDTINIVKDPITHTLGNYELAQRVTNNLKQAIFARVVEN